MCILTDTAQGTILSVEDQHLGTIKNVDKQNHLEPRNQGKLPLGRI